MTPAATTSTRRSTVLSWVLAIGLLLTVAVLVAPSGDDAPLDPRSRGPRGTAAMLAVVDELGADVEIRGDLPADTDATVLVLEDRLDDPVRDELAAWVESGGRLVLLDPLSPLNPAPAVEQRFTDAFGAVGERPGCELLDGFVDRVESARWFSLDAPDDATATCFPIGNSHGLVVAPVGDGEVVVTGAADALTNRYLGAASHGRFAAALLAPSGTGEVVVLWDDALGGGDTPLLTLLPTGVKAAAAMLALAAVVFAWSRARRLGAPTREALPVRVPGSELVVAIGELLERHGHRDEAAARIRADLRRELAAALSVPTDTPADVLAELATARLGSDLDTGAITHVLGGAPVPDDDALAALAAAAARVRHRLRRPDTHETSPGDGPGHH